MDDLWHVAMGQIQSNSHSFLAGGASKAGALQPLSMMSLVLSTVGQVETTNQAVSHFSCITEQTMTPWPTVSLGTAISNTFVSCQIKEPRSWKGSPTPEKGSMDLRDCQAGRLGIASSLPHVSVRSETKSTLHLLLFASSILSSLQRGRPTIRVQDCFVVNACLTVHRGTRRLLDNGCDDFQQIPQQPSAVDDRLIPVQDQCDIPGG